MSSEYAMNGQFSVKFDAFSFGVLVLEIISGQNSSFQIGENIDHLLSYVSIIILLFLGLMAHTSHKFGDVDRSAYSTTTM